MLSSFGTTVSTISLLLSLSLLYLSYYDLKLSNNKISKKIYKFAFSQILLTFLSFITLIIAYVISDFSLIMFMKTHIQPSLCSIRFQVLGEIMKEVYYCGLIYWYYFLFYF